MSAATGALIEPPGGIDRRSAFSHGLNDFEIIQTNSKETAVLSISNKPKQLRLLKLGEPGTRDFLRGRFGRKPFGLVIDARPNLRLNSTRIILRRAAVILVNDEDLAAVVIQAGIPPDLVVSRCAWDPNVFTSIRPLRSEATAHRLVFAGELSPMSGAIDFQLCAAHWARHHPDRQMDITWAGDGDLRAVLDAQPLPPNLRQRFIGHATQAALANIFGASGILAVPDMNGSHNAPLREAAAAGLPIMGSSRNHLVTWLVLPGETGWLFDPLQPRVMADALSDAMSATIDRLNTMRVAVRARVLTRLEQRQSRFALSFLNTAP